MYFFVKNKNKIFLKIRSGDQMTSKLSKLAKIFGINETVSKEEDRRNKIQAFLDQCGQYDKDCYNNSIGRLRQLYPEIEESVIENDQNEIVKVIARVFGN